MSEYVIRLPQPTMGQTAGAPAQEYSNAGQSFMNRELTVNNTASIAGAVILGKQVVKTTFGTAIDQIGNARLEETINKVSKVAGYVGIGAVNPYLALGKVGVDVITYGIERAVYIQDTNLDNAYKQATRGVATSLGGRYG